MSSWILLSCWSWGSGESRSGMFLWGPDFSPHQSGQGSLDNLFHAVTPNWHDVMCKSKYLRIYRIAAYGATRDYAFSITVCSNLDILVLPPGHRLPFRSKTVCVLFQREDAQNALITHNMNLESAIGKSQSSIFASGSFYVISSPVTFVQPSWLFQSCVILYTKHLGVSCTNVMVYQEHISNNKSSM